MPSLHSFDVQLWPYIKFKKEFMFRQTGQKAMWYAFQLLITFIGVVLVQNFLKRNKMFWNMNILPEILYFSKNFNIFLLFSRYFLFIPAETHFCHCWVRYCDQIVAAMGRHLFSTIATRKGKLVQLGWLSWLFLLGKLPDW